MKSHKSGQIAVAICLLATNKHISQSCVYHMWEGRCMGRGWGVSNPI